MVAEEVTICVFVQVVVIEQNGSFQLRIPKNFICEHCYGAFRSSYHLKRHILIHTGKQRGVAWEPKSAMFAHNSDVGLGEIYLQTLSVSKYSGLKFSSEAHKHSHFNS